MAESNQIFTITVDRTLDVALDLLTRRKAFAIIDISKDEAARILANNLNKRKVRIGSGTKDAEGDQMEKPDTWKYKDSENEGTRFIDNGSGCFYELLAPKEHPQDDSFRCLLFVGESIHSRDDESRVNEVMRQLADQGIDEGAVTFPSVQELYAMTKGYTLRCKVYADDEEGAVLVWNELHLGIGSDKGQNYHNRDSSLITLHLQWASDESRSCCPADPLSTLADPAEFSAYGEMFAKMAEDACGPVAMVYGDDLLVDYAISHGDEVTRCIATEFFTNHKWDIDPTTLLTLRVKARISPQPCDDEALRFSHPTKAVRRMSDGKKFYLQSITTTNDIEVKFFQGGGEDREPDTLVSADRTWDNLVDFFLWLEIYRREILLE